MSLFTPSLPTARRTTRGIIAALRVCTAALVIALACAVPSTALHAENPYWDQYGMIPVYMKQSNSPQALKFIDIKDGMLVAQLDDGVGEMSMPVSDSMARTLQVELKQRDKAKRQAQMENFAGAVEILRPEIYPLIKFHEIPESFLTMHTAIRDYLDLLISAEAYDEAYDLLGRINLAKVDPKYSNIAVKLMNTYIGLKDFKKVTALAQSMPVEGKHATNIRPVLNATDALRGAGEYEAVIPMYRKMLSAVSPDQKRNVNMWLAYSLVLADRLDEAAPIISATPEPAPGDELFSLYKLLQGSRAYREKKYSVALDTLTRGFVRAQTSYSWVPETLFLIGDCYAFQGDKVAAKNVWTEITILYPSSPWAERAIVALTELPNRQP